MSASNKIMFYFTILFFIAPLASFAQQKSNKNIEKLCGRWATFSSLYTFFESWKKSNDSVFVGNTIMIFKNDTLFNDNMKLIKIGKKWELITKSQLDVDLPEKVYILSRSNKNKLIFLLTDPKETEQLTYSFVEPEVMVINISTREKSVNSYRMRKVSK